MTTDQEQPYSSVGETFTVWLLFIVFFAMGATWSHIITKAQTWDAVEDGAAFNAAFIENAIEYRKQMHPISWLRWCSPEPVSVLDPLIEGVVWITLTCDASVEIPGREK